MGSIVPDKPVKFRDPHSKGSQEIPTDTVKGSIFTFFHSNFRQQVISDVISGVDV